MLTLGLSHVDVGVASRGPGGGHLRCRRRNLVIRDREDLVRKLFPILALLVLFDERGKVGIVVEILRHRGVVVRGRCSRVSEGSQNVKETKGERVKNVPSSASHPAMSSMSGSRLLPTSWTYDSL
jgi:hypothetical protein